MDFSEFLAAFSDFSDFFIFLPCLFPPSKSIEKAVSLIISSQVAKIKKLHDLGKHNLRNNLVILLVFQSIDHVDYILDQAA